MIQIVKIVYLFPDAFRHITVIVKGYMFFKLSNDIPLRINIYTELYTLADTAKFNNNNNTREYL